jgi:hypothetical protein
LQPPPQAVTVDVVATGLDSPRGIAIGPAGRILVIEAGTGGATPTMTGHVTEIFKGKMRRLLTLPSVFVPNGEISGPTSIAVPTGLGEMFVTMGAGPNPPFGDLLRANPALTSFIADIELHEWTHNPDGVIPPDSNPYGVAVVGDGSKLVADAAANTLLQVDRDGTVHTVAVFPTAPNPLFAPPPGMSIGGPTVQAVPTSIAIGPDGAWYVGELRGVSVCRAVAYLARRARFARRALRDRGYDWRVCRLGWWSAPRCIDCVRTRWRSVCVAVWSRPGTAVPAWVGNAGCCR